MAETSDPVRTTKKRQRGYRTSAKIRDKAVDLFHDQGFRATTMRDLASACDLTPAAFYNHFPRKDDLLFELIVDAFERNEATVRAALAAAGPTPREQLVAAVQAMTQWHIENDRQARVANREALELESELLEKVLVMKRRFRSILERVIASGVTAGDFELPGRSNRSSTRLVAKAILELIRSSDSSHSTPRPRDLPEIYAELALRLVAAGS